ncbi:MAG: hypothetical protein AAGC55_04325 [Myxococcota bacterium]
MHHLFARSVRDLAGFSATRSCAHAVMATLAVTLWLGCSIDTRSGQFACSPDELCPDGRQCIDGWCVTDSGDEPPDGGIDPASDAAMCIPSSCGDGTCCTDESCCDGAEDADSCPDDCGNASCTGCLVGQCSESCDTQEECSLRCSGVCTCNLSCTSAKTCDFLCRAGQTCDLSCAASQDCNATCQTAADCTINCTNVERCDDIRCIVGSSCLLDCSSSKICDFKQCSGGSGVMSCANNIIVCNRPCPEDG